MDLVSAIVTTVVLWYSVGMLLEYIELSKELDKTQTKINKLNSTLDFKGRHVEEHDSLNYIDSAMFLSMYDE